MRITVSYLLVFILGSLAVDVQSELFTAIVDLEKVLHAEHDVAEDLKVYIESEQRRIDALRRISKNFEEHSETALHDPEKHLSNPVNAFLVVKRFTADWDRVMDRYVRDNATNEFLERLSSKMSYFPSYEDLAGAANALLRLQDTYDLSTDKLASGDVQGASDSLVMTASDCFELGRLAYLENDFYHTILWMRQALTRLEEDSDSEDFHRAYVLDYLAYALFMIRRTSEC